VLPRASGPGGTGASRADSPSPNLPCVPGTCGNRPCGVGRDRSGRRRPGSHPEVIPEARTTSGRSGPRPTVARPEARGDAPPNVLACSARDQTGARAGQPAIATTFLPTSHSAGSTRSALRRARPSFAGSSPIIQPTGRGASRGTRDGGGRWPDGRHRWLSGRVRGTGRRKRC
jgi:hypothetical protein